MAVRIACLSLFMAYWLTLFYALIFYILYYNYEPVYKSSVRNADCDKCTNIKK